MANVGAVGLDWQERINWDRLRKYRLERARAKMKEHVVAIKSLTIPFQYYNRFATVLDGGAQDGVQYYFIDCPELFDR